MSLELIDKTSLVAEIEKRQQRIKKGIFSIPLIGSDRAYATFEYEILGKVKDFLETLEVKDPWKPTDKQLEALEWSLGDYRNVIFEERHDTLTSLYNDLKKLKGE